jgi:phenylpropionate dioxygenase-like ring-hydroxylating dioxygenase large terminal subunit
MTHKDSTEPFTEGSAGAGFVRNRWYAAVLSRDVSRTPKQTWVLDVPIVLFRKVSNEVVALRDVCPHRHAPLSLGTVVGDEIQCRYHGFQFDSAGHCTRIPSEKVIPSAIRAEPVVVREALGFVWVWGGESAKADPSLLISFPWLEKPGFVSYHLATIVEAPLQPIIDNLMDLTHVHFVHSILGATNLVHESEPMQAWEARDHVLYRRALKQRNAASEQYTEIGGEFIPPSIVITSSVPKCEGSDEIQPGPMAQALHCLTPRNAQSTTYLALRCWNALTQPHEIAAIQHQTDITLAEDKAIIEAQYQNRSAASSDEKLIKSDRAAIMARRVYERILRADDALGA